MTDIGPLRDSFAAEVLGARGVEVFFRPTSRWLGHASPDGLGFGGMQRGERSA
jgi:hypothetical protein